MTEYMELAAAELAKIRQGNRELGNRAIKARENGEDTRATAMEAVVTATSFRLAEDYIALAALRRDAVTPDHGQG